MISEISPEMIPPDILDAARLIENWMKGNGNLRWELLGICSRNHAELARQLERELNEVKVINSALMKRQRRALSPVME